MKNLKNMDLVQLAGIAGSVLSIAATILSNYSKDAKMDKEIEDKVNRIIEIELQKRLNG